MKTGLLFGPHGKSGMTSGWNDRNARTEKLSAFTMVISLNSI